MAKNKGEQKATVVLTEELKEKPVPVVLSVVAEVKAESENLCPVCLEHGERHVMVVELDDWICGRCHSLFPRERSER